MSECNILIVLAEDAETTESDTNAAYVVFSGLGKSSCQSIPNVLERCIHRAKIGWITPP